MKTLALLGMLLLLLAGCVDYNEELWLNKDGSGRLGSRWMIGVLTNYLNQQEITVTPASRALRSSARSSSPQAELHLLQFGISFRFPWKPSIKSATKISMPDFLGKITLTKEKDGQEPSCAGLPLAAHPADDDEIEQLILSHPQDNLKWRYKLHLPDIVKTNAATVNTDMTTNTETSYLWNKSQKWR